MYSPKQTLIGTFINYLQATYQSVFGHGQPQHTEFLCSVANLSLATIACSDALYHDLEHTILVTSVGQEILQAKQVCEGGDAVTSEDWLHLITALLCHDVGYCKGACRHDDCEAGRYATGIAEEFIVLPFGATDALLGPYHVDRSKLFVQEQFEHVALIDSATVQRVIDRTRFPASAEHVVADIRGLADLGRAADLIGQFSDRSYLQKLPALFYEFEQSGANDHFGYRHVQDVRSGLTEFYWNCVHGYVKDAIAYLKHTAVGQQIVMELNANLSADKTRLCA